MHFDTIIIGSGISGLNFALRSAEQGQRVLVVTKKKVAQSGTNFAQGGIAAVLSQLDNYRKHKEDTLVAGCFHNNKSAVAYMVKHGPEAVRRLIELGVPFATHEGKLLLAKEGGHGERRIAFVSDYTGAAIEKVLVAKAKKNSRITIWEHTFAAELLVKNNICFGVQVLRGRRMVAPPRRGSNCLAELRLGVFENIFGQRIVLATGGIGQIYEHTTNPNISTGDGIAMAARAGCRFRDLEFVQFHPTAFHRKGTSAFLISEAVRGEGANLRNSAGHRFMVGRHKLAELAPRDIVARAIFEESKKGPVYLDLRHKKAAYIKTRFPQIYETLASHGLKMEKDLIPIFPAAHYLCGGVRVNLRGETGIKHLYAFGEVAWTGVHGANRLASNSLLEALVFSDRIIGAFPNPKKPNQDFAVPKFQPLTKREHKKLLFWRNRLRHVMQMKVGIVRTKKELAEAIVQIQELKHQLQALPQSNTGTLEFSNMLEVALRIITAALKRNKSLGCHFLIPRPASAPDPPK